MIETEEQYVDWFPIDTACRIDWDESDINDVHETIEALRKVVRGVVVECERPENRGRMTQRQQANFLDTMRSTIKDALPDWITESERD